MEQRHVLLEIQPFEAPQNDGLEQDVQMTGEDNESWQLMQRVQRGMSEGAAKDEVADTLTAFAEIYNRYYAGVYTAIYRRTKSDPKLAEDLTNDVFLRAYKNATKFTWQGKDLGAWLHVIAANIACDHMKSSYARLVVNGYDGRNDPRSDQTPLGYPEQMALARVRRDELMVAMRQLTDDQQKVIVFRYFEERTIQETAEATGKDEGAVKALASRGLQSLNRILTAMDEGVAVTMHPRRHHPQPAIASFGTEVFIDDHKEGGVIRIGNDFFAADADILTRNVLQEAGHSEVKAWHFGQGGSSVADQMGQFTVRELKSMHGLEAT